MAIEMESTTIPCCKCGRAYKQRRGFFPVSYSVLYKGIGYMPVCKDCIDKMYNDYLIECGNSKDAVRQVCRKLDLYWSDELFVRADSRSSARTMMSGYLTKLNTIAQSGKCYDDTLREEGTIWQFLPEVAAPAQEPEPVAEPQVIQSVEEEKEPEEEIEISEDVSAFWGPGLSPVMYRDLEQRRQFWLKDLGEESALDIGTKALLRQICILEVAINQDRAAGRSIDKNVNALNSLMGSASLKPAQKKEDANEDAALASIPLGVWLYRYEQKRPLPQIDDDMKDVNGIRKYVFTWMGHLCKMLGIKNGYTNLYDREIARLSVEKPHYEGDDDEAMVDVLFEEGGEDDDDDEDFTGIFDTKE